MYIDPHVHMPGFEGSNRTSSARRVFEHSNRTSSARHVFERSNRTSSARRSGDGNVKGGN